TAGLLTHYLPLSCSLSNDQHFSEILTQVKQAKDEVDQLQRLWGKPIGYWNRREPAYGDTERPLSFPFGFDFSHWPAASVVDGISFSFQECHTYQEPFKIQVSAIQKTDETLMLAFHYNASLFSFNDIKCMADQYATLLQSALAQPEALLCELEILS